MLDIVGIAVAGPAQALGHHRRELQGVQLGVAAVVGKDPGDIAAAEVVALESQGNPVNILRAVCPGLGQAGRQILNPHSNGILRVAYASRSIGVFGIKGALGGLHGVVALTAAFLHHHSHDQLRVFRDALFFGVKLDQPGVGFHLIADRGLFQISAATEQSTHCPKQQEQRKNQKKQAAASGKGRLGGGSGRSLSSGFQLSKPPVPAALLLHGFPDCGALGQPPSLLPVGLRFRTGSLLVFGRMPLGGAPCWGGFSCLTIGPVRFLRGVQRPGFRGGLRFRLKMCLTVSNVNKLERKATGRGAKDWEHQSGWTQFYIGKHDK